MKDKDWRQPLLITWNMVSYPKIPTTRLRCGEGRLVLYTIREHYTEGLSMVYSYDVLAWKRVIKPWKKLIQECGAHQSGPKLYHRIKRMGYYWPTMVKYCLDHAKKCEACQLHVNYIHQLPEPLHPTVVSWPYDAWGLDIVEPLPKSSGSHL